MVTENEAGCNARQMFNEQREILERSISKERSIVLYLLQYPELNTMMIGDTMQTNNFKKNSRTFNCVFDFPSLDLQLDFSNGNMLVYKQDFILSVYHFIYQQKYTLQQQMAKYENANCYENVMLKILNNFADLNSFFLA